MWGWGATSIPCPGGSVAGPKWSKKTKGPTMRRCIDGSVRCTASPPTSRGRADMQSSIEGDSMCAKKGSAATGRDMGARRHRAGLLDDLAHDLHGHVRVDDDAERVDEARDEGRRARC